MVRGWRFRARRASSGLWLDHNVILDDPTLSWVLSGPNSGRASVPHGSPLAMGSDGRDMFGKWDTILYAEYDDLLRWSGICTSASPTQKGMQLEFISTLGWFAGLPYLGEYHTWKRELWAVVREILTATNPGHPNARVTHGINFQSRFTGAEGYFVGDPKPPDKPVIPPREQGTSDAEWETITDKIKKKQEAWEEEFGQNSQYELLWWEAPMVGTELDNLAKYIGFEYRETIFGPWEQNAIPVIEFSDRFRTRRTDIQLVDGINMARPPEPKQTDARFANDVITLGSGEGRSMMRGEYAEDDGRLSQTEIIPYKAVYNKTQLDALAKADFKTCNDKQAKIDTVTIWDSPGFAAVTTLRVGDEVLVKSLHTRPHLSQWSRIISITRNTKTNVTVLNLESVG